MTIAQPEVLLERRCAIAIITLSQPDRHNAFTQEMRESVAEMFAQLADEVAIRAVVITGAEGNFCAGADVSRVVQFEPGILPQRRAIHRRLRRRSAWSSSGNRCLEKAKTGRKP